MKLNQMQQLSVLAAATGVVLALIFFGGLYFGIDTPDWLPMMIAAIGGFELFLFGHDMRQKLDRRGPRG